MRGGGGGWTFGDPTLWQVIDQNTVTDTSFFGSMIMQGQRYEQVPPQDDIRHCGASRFSRSRQRYERLRTVWRRLKAPTAVTGLLARHNITPNTWTLIAHQASTVLFDMWQAQLQPAQMIETIANFANMTVANIPVNLAWSVANQPISQNNLVLFALSPDMHANALLLQRSCRLGSAGRRCRTRDLSKNWLKSGIKLAILVPEDAPSLSNAKTSFSATLIGGRYELLDRLGAGGMGEVYRSRDRLSEEIVALKRALQMPSALTDATPTARESNRSDRI